MPLNLYAELDPAALSDLHDGCVGLLLITERLLAEQRVPANDWQPVADNLNWLQSQVDAELEARRLLLPEPK
jgi:hypothetical protein